MTSTGSNLFKPGKASSADKASANDHSAKNIIAAEKIARDKKTEKLKALRLERAATEPQAPPPAPKTSRKPQRP
ncbi:hypothetical protein PWG15_10850 [Ensifer adhaerens]|uniref:hypothetical protein n=1 Tax=Ensifer adhaerens TaxID=106592 RepID=UPI0023A92FD0|nr:hypothetical protein [Ensifer adhaerens]WDZ78940.1 hypothetical protein PWG15_10850 [Ensifer adhaerens]